jgi:hypothetical protein
MVQIQMPVTVWPRIPVAEIRAAVRTVLQGYLGQMDLFRGRERDFKYGHLLNNMSYGTHLELDGEADVSLTPDGGILVHQPVKAVGEHKVGLSHVYQAGLASLLCHPVHESRFTIWQGGGRVRVRM